MSQSAPWMKFWPADFMMETQHLTAAEVGHHVRLLCLAWRRVSCAIPNDRDWIKRRLGVSDEDYEREVAPVLAEFWPEQGDDRVNENLRLAYSDMVAKSEKSRQAALTRHHGSQWMKRRAKAGPERGGEVIPMPEPYNEDF